jgi:glycosyltransferase involved in cell wall biosynthesis
VTLDATRFTLVLPCFNEGSRIAASLATLDSWFGSAAEIIVIDDGSSDDTTRRAEEFSAMHPNVRVHQLAHGGKGKAIRTAIPLASCDRVLLTDADLAYDRDSIRRVLDALSAADMAAGSRRHAGSRYSVPVNLFGFLYRRHLVGLTFNMFVRSLLSVTTRDTQCGLKGFRREALDSMAPSLSADGFTIDVEMLLVARALGLRLAEVPVHVTYYSAKSSAKLVRSGAAMVSEIVRMAVRRARGCYAPARVRASAATSPRKRARQSREEPVR